MPERQAAEGGPQGHLQAQPDRVQLVRREAPHRPEIRTAVGPIRVKPCFSNAALAAGAAQEGQEARGAVAGALRGQRRRIDDRRVAVGREGADDPDARVGGGVGPVDDAERRLAARDQGQRRAHVLGLGELALDAAPGTQMLERRLGVLAGRHGLDLADREPPVAEQRRQIEARTDRDLADACCPCRRSARGCCPAGSCACRRRSAARCSR